MSVLPIYLDYNSTTPADPDVVEAMLPYFSQRFGNASSVHRFGLDAESAVRLAREQVAALINANPEEIIFTSGATESSNLVIKGLGQNPGISRKICTVSSTEHKAILDPAESLKLIGKQIEKIPVLSTGLISSPVFETLVDESTFLIAVMLANNETGVIQPVSQFAKSAKGAGSFFLCDAVQAAGKIPIDVKELGVDFLLLSSHKLYGPKGAGVLFISKRVPRSVILPLIDGGGHESGLRSGTLNVPAIVGFGKACELAKSRMNEDSLKVINYRNQIERALLAAFPQIVINGIDAPRLPNTLSFSVPGLRPKQLIKSLKLLAVSSGSACTSANPAPSHVLLAMGISTALAENTIRISLGRTNTQEEIDHSISILIETIGRVTS
ncbi:MAG: cysteine desulfurase [Bacteroidetes bacterium]|nr:cysteine desulfurase [Bacteroidota bacterium]